MVDDEQRWSNLMHRTQKGDEEAYHQLLCELSKVINAYLCRQFGQAAFIDDCVQESLIAIHKARHTYNHERPFKPWMNALVKYKTIDVLRKYNTEYETYDIEDLFVQNELQQNTNNYSIDDHLAGMQLLNKIPRTYSEVLLCTKFMGFSVEETAERLNISQSAVKQRVKRAISKTKNLLQANSI